MHLAATREPYHGMKEYTRNVLGMMEHHWRLPAASIVISITGSAQHIDLPARLENAFKRGLANAAVATNAWIVTGVCRAGAPTLDGPPPRCSLVGRALVWTMSDE